MMFIRVLTFVVVVSSLVPALLGDCTVIQSGTCVEFSSVFGYQERTCTSQGDCDQMEEGAEWVCPQTEDAYNYSGNSFEFTHDPFENQTGYTSVTYAQGDVCVSKRVCEGCSTIALPNGKRQCLYALNSVWVPFIWGADISYAGAVCP